MKTNDVACFYECDDVFMGAISHVSIAFIEHLNCMSVALDILPGDGRHTIYIPHSSVPQIVQALSSSYYSIADTMKQMEEEQGGK
jgi:hypothetical protein